MHPSTNVDGYLIKSNHVPAPRVALLSDLQGLKVNLGAGLGSILDTVSKDTEDTAPLVSVTVS